VIQRPKALVEPLDGSKFCAIYCAWIVPFSKNEALQIFCKDASFLSVNGVVRGTLPCFFVKAQNRHKPLPAVAIYTILTVDKKAAAK